MNCKPGDMAVVVSGTNLGLIVEVLGVSDYYGLPFWRVKTAWLVKGALPEGGFEWVRVGSIHDARLRPIRPDDRSRTPRVEKAPAVHIN